MSYSEYNERLTINDIGLKILLISSAFLSVGILAAVYVKTMQEGGDTTELLFALGVVLLLEVLVFMLLFLTPLVIDGSSEGIQVRYKPFLLSSRMFSWQEISSWQIRKVSPMGEFGGWGMRKALRKKKTGLITGGGKALEIQLHSGHTWVISTGNPEMLAIFCRKYAEDKEVTE